MLISDFSLPHEGMLNYFLVLMLTTVIQDVNWGRWGDGCTGPPHINLSLFYCKIKQLKILKHKFWNLVEFCS